MRAVTLRPIARRALAAQSDERLIRLVRDGHEPAFEEIVRRYRGPLVTFATAIVSHHRAEDVVQVSLAKAHRALQGEPKEINLRPWLFAIVRNAALNVIRDEPIADQLAPDFAGGAGPDAIAEQHDELDRLVLAICALPRSQREALVRRELDGAGHADIAAQLGTTATAVRGLIFRARTTLRDAVGALVPLPLMRQLLESGAAAGAASAGAAGAGVAVIGATGAKGGVALTAAVLALATGVAIERDRGQAEPERAEAAESRAGSPASRRSGEDVQQPASPTAAAAGGAATSADGGTGADADPELRSSKTSGRDEASSASFGPSESADSSEADADPPDPIKPSGDDDQDDDSGHGGGDDDPGNGPTGDDHGASGHGPGSGSEPPDDDNSGPGGGGPPHTPEPPDDDNSGPDSDGGDGEDHSGPDDDADAPPPPPPPRPDDDDDSSGPGAGTDPEVVD